MAATVAAIFMLPVLQDFPLLFQRFPTTVGCSMQHGCDMEILTMATTRRSSYLQEPLLVAVCGVLPCVTKLLVDVFGSKAHLPLLKLAGARKSGECPWRDDWKNFTGCKRLSNRRDHGWAFKSALG